MDILISPSHSYRTSVPPIDYEKLHDLVSEESLADEIVRDIEVLQAPTVTLWNQFELYTELLYDAIPLVLTALITNLQSMWTFYLLKDNPNPAFSVAVGYYSNMLELFFEKFDDGIGSNLGLIVSQCIGAKKHESAKEYFFIGLLTYILTSLLISMPGFYFSGYVISLLNVSQEEVKVLTGLTRTTMPIFIVKSINSTLLNYCYSQDVVWPFWGSGVGSIILSGIISYIMIVKTDIGVYGFVYSSMINDFFQLIFYILVLKYVGNQSLFGWPKQGISWIKTRKFFIDSFMFVMDGYLIILGKQITIIYITQTKNANMLEAYLSATNIFNFVWIAGESMGNVYRTKASILIGMCAYIPARRFFHFIFYWSLALPLLPCLLLLLYPSPFAELYALRESPEFPYLTAMLSWSALFLPFFFATPLLTSSYRSTGHMPYLLLFAFFALLVLNLALDAVLDLCSGKSALAYVIAWNLAVSVFVAIAWAGGGDEATGRWAMTGNHWALL